MSQPSRGKPWRRLLGVAWILATAVAIAFVVADRWEDVQPALAALELSTLLVATALAVLGVGASSRIWHALLAGLGVTLPWRQSARIFFVGQLGKYLPGSLWPLLTQAEMGRSVGIARRVSAAAVVLFLWVHLVSAGLLAVLLFPAMTDAPAWVAVLALPLAGLLIPEPLNAAIAWILRLARREPLPATPQTGHVLRALGWAGVMWGLYGLHLVVLANAVHPGEVDWGFAVGVFAASWAAGFVVLVAPAGAGARELAFLALLTPQIGAGGAFAAVLVSRLLLTLADALWGFAALALRVPRGSSQSTSTSHQ